MPDWIRTRIHVQSVDEDGTHHVIEERSEALIELDIGDARVLVPIAPDPYWEDVEISPEAWQRELG